MLEPTEVKAGKILPRREAQTKQELPLTRADKSSGSYKSTSTIYKIGSKTSWLRTKS